MTGVYISGTDTGVGKTLVSATLLAAFQRGNCLAVGMKPVASGCASTAHGLRNADAELLRAWSRPRPPYALVNPFALAEPVAPHLAARASGVDIALAPLTAAYAALAAQADVVVVEGFGGWLAPLSERLMQADLVRALQLPVILVVGMRLGCLNHALLSARAIAADDCRLAGWIASVVDPDMPRLDDNLDTLRERLPAPCLGVLPAQAAPDPAVLAPQLEAALRLLTEPH